MSASYSGGGGCSSGGGSGIGLSTGEALTFLAALAFAVAFLNSQITMLLGKKRRRKKRSIVSEFEGEFIGYPHFAKSWKFKKIKMETP